MKRWDLRPWARRMPLVTSFAVVSLVLTIGLGWLLSAQIQHSVSQRGVRELEKTTTSAVALTVNLIVTDVGRTATGVPVSLAEEQKEIRLITSAAKVLLANGDAVGVEAALANGLVIGGAGASPVGAKLAVDSRFRAALRGSTVLNTLKRSDLRGASPVEQRLLRANGDLLVFQQGVRARPSEPILVIVRAYAPLKPTQELASADIRTTVLGLALGLLVFWLVLFPLVLGASRALTRQSEVNTHQATHDALTGLPNRLLLRDRVEQAIAASRRSGAQVALLLMDLDRFKEINDTLGHRYGDIVLKLIGSRLAVHLRDADTVARLGGDEFVVLLPDLRSAPAALAIAEKLAAALHEPFVIDGVLVDVGASVGVAFTPEHGDDFDQLLQHADVAMYLAKKDSLGVVVYAPELDSYSPSRLTLLGELRRALDTPEQIVLYYQPKAELPSGRINGVEALVRWQHPDHGLLAPDTFIPLAERTGVIRPLTWCILRKALEQNRDWARQGLVLEVAVNISARCLLDVGFAAEVARLLVETEVPAERLELELTESAIMADPEHARVILQTLADSGVRLAIDDFGTGYSSMAYLKKLPVHVIKIDRTFVTDMAADLSDAAIVRSSLQLARNLALDVVAEGVETLEVWRQLADLGCTEAQGYFLTRPVPAADFVSWLGSYRAPALASEASKSPVAARHARA